ncbi:MAG: hypothetical protein HZB37_00400 [Planctomycetes bacterium]|nr:hypothetical protein [Planctomycetota bacterium]
MRKHFFILSTCLFLSVVAIAGNLKAESQETNAPLAPAFLDGDWVVAETVECCNNGETFSSSWTFTYLGDATMGDIRAKVYSLVAVRTLDGATRNGVGLEIGKKLVIFQDCYDYPGECHHEIFTKKSKPNLTGKLKCACENGDVFPGNFTAHR